MKLTVRNFTVHELLELNLKRLNVITGPNGSGKTSIARALEILVCGITSDLRKKDLGQLIRHGSRSAELALEHEGLRITVRITPSGPRGSVTLNGRKVGGQEARELIRTKLGLFPEQFPSLLSPSPKPGADRLLDTVQEVLGARPSPLLLKKVSRELPEETRGLDLFQEIVARSQEAPSLRELHAVALERRRQLKRLIAELKRPLPPETLTLDGKEIQLADLDPESVRGKLKRLEELRDRALLAAEREKRRKSLERTIREIEEQLADGRTSGLSRREQELLRIRESLEDSFRMLSAKVELFDLLLRDRQCPFLKALCPSIADRAQEAEEKLLEAVGELEKARQELHTVREELQRVQSALRASGSEKELRARLDSLRKELSSLKETATKEDPEELGRRIERGRQLLQALEQFRTASDTRKRIAQLENELQHTERIVSFLAPGGPVDREIRRRLDGFRSHFNEIASSLQLPVTLNEVLEPETDRVLSRSERRGVEVAARIALARLGGARLLVLDDMELFDSRRKAALLKELFRSGVTALVLATSDTPPREAKNGNVLTLFLAPADGEEVRNAAGARSGL